MNSRGIKVEFPESVKNSKHSPDIDIENLEVILDDYLIRYFWIKADEPNLEFWRFISNSKLDIYLADQPVMKYEHLEND